MSARAFPTCGLPCALCYSHCHREVQCPHTLRLEDVRGGLADFARNYHGDRRHVWQHWNRPGDDLRGQGLQMHHLCASSCTAVCVRAHDIGWRVSEFGPWETWEGGVWGQSVRSVQQFLRQSEPPASCESSGPPPLPSCSKVRPCTRCATNALDDRAISDLPQVWGGDAPGKPNYRRGRDAQYVAQQCEANQSYWTPLQVISLPAEGCPCNQCPCNQYPCNQCRWPRCIGLLKSLPLAYSCCVRAKFANPDNAKTHMLTTGPEIWEQTAGAVDYFVAGAGTAGTVAAANGRPGGGSTLLQPPLAHFGGCCYGKFVSRLTAHTACPQPTGGWGWGVPEGD